MADRHIPDASSRLTAEPVRPERSSARQPAGQSPELHPSAPSDPASRPAPADSTSLTAPSESRGAGITRQQCGECLGAVAHRLSQPLTVLRGSLELALRAELSAQESRAALEQAFELTELVVQLMRSLRELAEAAIADTPPKRLSLRDLVREIVEELQGLADSRGVKTLLEASLEAMVAAPPDRLREVISKLLCLVIQRSPPKGEIRLALSRQPTGGSAGLLIADQGPSPGPGEFDFASGGTAGFGCLFAEAAKNPSADGLEWAVVKVLAESLGGTLQLMPRNPQGCCFLLQLPLADSQKP